MTKHLPEHSGHLRAGIFLDINSIFILFNRLTYMELLYHGKAIKPVLEFMFTNFVHSWTISVQTTIDPVWNFTCCKCNISVSIITRWNTIISQRTILIFLETYCSKMCMVTKQMYRFKIQDHTDLILGHNLNQYICTISKWLVLHKQMINSLFDTFIISIW